jgi:NADH/NAD ratio-sensing transcriptional regulator Rex
VSWKRDERILARLAEVERLHLRGKSNRAIAEKLHVNEKTIRNDLERINELWQERTTLDIDGLRARRFAELELVKREALQSFDFDMAMIEAVMLGKPIEGEDGVTRHVQRDDDGRAQYKADKVAALAQYRQAVMDQAKLYGLIVEKVDMTLSVRQEAERLARELGLDPGEVIAEAEALLKGGMR